VAGIILKEEVKGKKEISYIKKHRLIAMKCDCCGLIFKMDRWCNDNLDPAILKGTFDRSATNNKGEQLGNMFDAMVCSFKCADAIFNDGWKDIPGYYFFKRCKAVLVRVEIGLTKLIKTEKELVNEWENGENTI